MNTEVLTLYARNMQTTPTLLDSVRACSLSDQRTILNKTESLLLLEETVDSFVLVDAKTLGRVLCQVNLTTGLLNPIPIALLKTFYGPFEGELLNTVNCSFQMDTFPAAFKQAVLKPLLKKSNLDHDIFNNYTPVSNLPFLSKTLEKLSTFNFYSVQWFLTKNNIFEKYQSGFRMNYNTGTALIKIVNDLRYSLVSTQNFSPGATGSKCSLRYSRSPYLQTDLDTWSASLVLLSNGSTPISQKICGKYGYMLLRGPWNKMWCATGLNLRPHAF